MKLCGFQVGLDQPFFLIAGPCVIESKQLALDTAGQLKEICTELGIPFIYKSSFDKANRSSGSSFRGLGMSEGLNILAEVQRQIGVFQLRPESVRAVERAEQSASASRQAFSILRRSLAPSATSLTSGSAPAHHTPYILSRG